MIRRVLEKPIDHVRIDAVNVHTIKASFEDSILCGKEIDVLMTVNARGVWAFLEYSQLYPSLCSKDLKEDVGSFCVNSVDDLQSLHHT